MNEVGRWSLLFALLFCLHGSSASQTSRSYGEELFQLCTSLLSKNNSVSVSTRNADSAAGTLSKIHLLRIPKASSSSLSVVARRIVGCEPPGPCCKWPGDPPGSCPAKGLFACQTEGRVIGCTHHYPNYEALRSPNILSISILREPWRRAVSAFFYPGIHHNSKCTGDAIVCFREYTQSSRWSNIAVKMLTGAYAYDDRQTCRLDKECKHSLETATRNLEHLSFMGVAEMWELSLLLLHLKMPMLKPDKSEFLIGDHFSPSSNISPATPVGGSGSGNRVNAGVSYQSFKARAFAESDLKSLLQRQNLLDSVLYQQVLERLCEDLHRYRLWQLPLIRQYWQEKNIAKNVSSRCGSSL